MNDFDDFQRRINEVYPSDKGLEYVTLQLAGRTGQVAKEVAAIVRGDYESKGVLIYELAVEKILGECHDVLMCVGLIATVLEKKLSDVIETRKQLGDSDVRKTG
jgi:NTP pyrophosphatase (non-canonical NTP hydrolase)